MWATFQTGYVGTRKLFMFSFLYLYICELVVKIKYKKAFLVV